MYVDTLLSRQHQNEKSTSFEQRVDALIKKRELIQNRRSSVNGHYMLNLHEHEHSMQIDPYGYDLDASRQKHRKHYHTLPHEDHKLEQIHLYPSGNSKPPPDYANNSISGDSEVSSIYMCFVCETDRHTSRFCSQM